MLHPSSPKHNDKSNTEQWINNFGKLFQQLDPIFVFLLQGFIFVKFFKCLFLLLLIDIHKFSPSGKQFDVLVDYPARARSAQPRRACALRALGLLLADGTPTVGGGKTF